MLARYYNHLVKELLETLTDYITPNFDQLKTELKKIYDFQKVKLRYNKKNLKEFCKTSRYELFRLLGTVCSHYRQFQKIAGQLKKKNQITEAKYNKVFWESIPRDFRPKVENLILRRDFNHNLSTPFSISQITTALENLFRRDRFDNDISDIDSDSDQSSATDSEEEEIEYARFRKGRVNSKKSKKLIKAKTKKRTKPSRVVTGAEAKKALDKLEAEASIAENQDEIEILIKRLQNMSLDDPNYPSMYYRVFKLDKDISHIVRPPLYALKPERGLASSYPPFHQSNGAIAYAADSRTFPRIDCYGCGDRGYQISNCLKMSELLVKGVIKKNEREKSTLR